MAWYRNCLKKSSSRESTNSRGIAVRLLIDREYHSGSASKIWSFSSVNENFLTNKFNTNDFKLSFVKVWSGVKLMVLKTCLEIPLMLQILPF
ncbi:MAG: hypothetical protein ACFFAH_08095 [Promethearchaeota archaeon]